MMDGMPNRARSMNSSRREIARWKKDERSASLIDTIIPELQRQCWPRRRHQAAKLLAKCCRISRETDRPARTGGRNDRVLPGGIRGCQAVAERIRSSSRSDHQPPFDGKTCQHHGLARRRPIPAWRGDGGMIDRCDARSISQRTGSNRVVNENEIDRSGAG